MNELIKSVFEVIQRADTETGILTTEFPTNFHESNPLNIIDSLRVFLEKNPESFSTQTITEKYESGNYTQFYDIYHDIKVASAIKIKSLKIGSKDYQNIDFFYKFSSEILLRESSLFKVALLNFSELSDTTELEDQISADFEKIGYSYASSNGEVVSYISEMPNPNASAFAAAYGYGGNPPPETIKQPLFTSQIGKSELDTRLTLIPEPYNLVKSIPLPNNVGVSSGTFESLNTQVSKIPLPTNKPTTMLDNFLYITWYIIKGHEWLTYNGQTLKPAVNSGLFKDNHKGFRVGKGVNESVRSFAPLTDSKGSGISEFLKNNIWLNQVGFKKLENIKNEYYKNLGKEVPKKPTQTSPKIQQESIDDDDYSPPNVSYDEAKPIDIEKVLKWDPFDIYQLHQIKKEKKDLESGNIQKLISKEILKLNKLRQDRYVRSSINNVMPASIAERKLYKKIIKLIQLTITLHQLEPNEIPLEFSKKIPVLMSDYSGTLPSLPSSKTRHTKLPTIRGPYKKKR